MMGFKIYGVVQSGFLLPPLLMDIFCVWTFLQQKTEQMDKSSLFGITHQKENLLHYHLGILLLSTRRIFKMAYMYINKMMGMVQLLEKTASLCFEMVGTYQ